MTEDPSSSVSLDRVTEYVTADHGPWDFSKALAIAHDILRNQEKGGGLMVRSRSICNWLKAVPTSVDVY